MAWTDELKAKAIEMYVDANPTPANSMEIVKEIAEEIGESVNGVRMILTKAEVYVKKEAAATKPGTSATKTDGTKAVRVSKTDAIDKLNAAITAAGKDVDAEITGKLTGKAAVYFADIIGSIGN